MDRMDFQTGLMLRVRVSCIEDLLRKIENTSDTEDLWRTMSSEAVSFLKEVSYIPLRHRKNLKLFGVRMQKSIKSIVDSMDVGYELSTGESNDVASHIHKQVDSIKEYVDKNRSNVDEYAKTRKAFKHSVNRLQRSLRGEDVSDDVADDVTESLDEDYGFLIFNNFREQLESLDTDAPYSIFDFPIIASFKPPLDERDLKTLGFKVHRIGNNLCIEDQVIIAVRNAPYSATGWEDVREQVVAHVSSSLENTKDEAKANRYKTILTHLQKREDRLALDVFDGMLRAYYNSLVAKETETEKPDFSAILDEALQELSGDGSGYVLATIKPCSYGRKNYSFYWAMPKTLQEKLIFYKTRGIHTNNFGRRVVSRWCLAF